MRCECCDDELDDREATAKLDGRFTNTCLTCLRFCGLYDKVKFRRDLDKVPPREVNNDAPELTEWERMNMRSLDEWEDS